MIASPFDDCNNTQRQYCYVPVAHSKKERLVGIVEVDAW